MGFIMGFKVRRNFGSSPFGRHGRGVAVAADSGTDTPRTPRPDQLDKLDKIVVGSLIVALVIIVVPILIAVCHCEARHCSQLGPVDWDFSTSWASTLTIVGAVLATVLAAGVLPDSLTSFPRPRPRA